jgi:hypothetical protein
MTKVLPSVINQDQSAYLKGRYIGENIRTITDIIDYCKSKRLSAILLLIDFEKAFDTVNWQFLEQVLKKFNFGEIFRKWIKILYTDVKSYIVNNGHFSDIFQILRDVRQGCPLSAYLFLLIVEMLAVNIRNSQNIKGIKLRTKEIKICQLADDTTLILENEESILHVKNMLNDFEKISGLKTNMDKTQAFMIGKHMRFKDDYGLKWNDGPIHILGLYICQTEKDSVKYNFEPNITKMKSIFNLWKQRNLSLKGKITIINSLAASLIVYPCSTLITPDTILDQIDQIFFNFLWDSNCNKISKNTIIRTIDQGGLKMIDIKSKVKALKIAWIKRSILKPNSSWKLILDDLLGDLTFDFAIRCTKLPEYYFQKLPLFYQIIIHDLNLLRHETPKLILEILSENLWYNNMITIDNKSFFWKKWQLHGIQYIDDLLDTQGEFLNLDALNEKYKVNCTFMDHLRIRQAIPGIWRQTITLHQTFRHLDEEHRPFYIINSEKSCNILTSSTKIFYWKFVNKNIHDVKPTCLSRWSNSYEIDPTIWPAIFSAPFKACRETQLQSFQYRVIHRILPCNEWLYIRKVISSDQCTYRYCDNPSTDTIRHFLITCSLVANFWKAFVTWWNRLEYSKLNPLVEENIILGFPCITTEDTVINYCLILAKNYIYRCKKNQKNISILSYLAILKDKMTVEEMICIQNNDQNHFITTWSHLYNKL